MHWMVSSIIGMFVGFAVTLILPEMDLYKRMLVTVLVVIPVIASITYMFDRAGDN